MTEQVDPVAQKRALRQMVRDGRRSRGVDGAQAASSAITQHLIEITREHEATTVATYLSTPDEPATRPYLDWAMQNGIRVLLPISRMDGLMDWAEYDETEIEGDFGVPEPGGDVLPPIAIEEADLIILPASAVDREGMRMGWGRGFFDKLLGSMEHLPPAYALVYDEEFLPSVPSEPHDHPVVGVVTPSGIHRIETN
ncbi:MAG TPA: 5-formyltetrahydrofolate cyclo-ligase [Candidatus Agrococcus pullicola]|uniref:5-formyltetrahydrofolate cyclo-ligase n=1 Tax=Candidatus Agrococcus pullicola TaxID=2838429 RepID=A0A9D2CAK3_9MICO|nr:5-formyltetrahydrofolate cyclo-ligase [Candidatus Agrococcus pullicola]